MRQRKVIKTTLGDLIAAVTDEVMPILRDPAGAYTVVSWVVNDVLTRQFCAIASSYDPNTKVDSAK